MPCFDGVIFDMDGTIVQPLLDFAAIRAELDIPSGQGILEALGDMPPERRREAHAKLVERELAAAERADLMPGAVELLRAIAQAGLKTALLTRNTREAMEMVLKRHSLRFDLAMSREDGPIKPEPDGIVRACSRLVLRPERTLCVGDFHYDITAAAAAGAPSALLVTAERPEWADEADYAITKLSELGEILGL